MTGNTLPTVVSNYIHITAVAIIQSFMCVSLLKTHIDENQYTQKNSTVKRQILAVIRGILLVTNVELIVRWL